MPVIVDSIKLKVAGALAHISKEVFKRLPAITDATACTAVNWVSVVIGVSTSAKNATPNSVRQSSAHSVRAVLSNDSFSLQTAA